MNKIQERINQLTAERAALEKAHNDLVGQNQKINQDFQQKVVQNQTRYAQLIGGITELKQLTNGETDEFIIHEPADLIVGS